MIQVGDLVKMDHIPDQTFIVIANDVDNPPAAAIVNTEDHDICFCVHTTWNRAAPKKNGGWTVTGYNPELLPPDVKRSYLRRVAMTRSGQVHMKMYRAKRKQRKLNKQAQLKLKGE